MTNTTHEPRSRVAIIGIGAIGASLAACLAAAGRVELTLCARQAFDELVVEQPSGAVLRIPATVVTRPEALDGAPFDWAILTTKAHQSADAAPWLRALAARGACIAVAQNGVEQEATVRPYVGSAPVLPVIVLCPAERLGPGRAKLREPIELTVPAGELGEIFRALFAGAAAAVDCSADFTTTAWSKLCVNVVGAVPALAASPWGILSRPDIAALARGLIAEAVAVGRAEGARLEPNMVETAMQRLARMAPTAHSSIVQDVLARRPLEYDVRNGAVVRAGIRHGIATPLNATLTALLAALSAGFAAS